MTLNEVREYFGSDNKACNALQINRQNYTHWRRRGGIPLVQQFKIQELTEGQLKADIKDIEKYGDKNE